MPVRAADEVRVPVSCLWELTLRCNMNCMHCGSIAGRPRLEELTLPECFDLVDQMADLGCEDLTLIGGEIFLYKGWEQIGRRASDRGITVNIMTNAYRIREREVQQIKEARLSNVGISLDGMAEHHNLIRRKKDSFAEIQSCFDLLNREGIPIGIVTSLMNFNLADLEDMYQLLVKNNVQVWQIQLVNPMGNLAGIRDFIVPTERVPWLIEFIQAKGRERRMMVVAADNVGYYWRDTEPCIRDARVPLCVWEGCQAGINGLFIDSVGNVKGCGSLYSDVFIEGNVRDRKLADIWYDENTFAYNRKFDESMLQGRCRHCDVGDVCKGGCRASNFFTTGSLYENAYCPHTCV